MLIPAGLRDVLLSFAHAKVFRPVWQSAIETEVYTNSVRLLAERRGLTVVEAVESAQHTQRKMREAFPDACVPENLWAPLVPKMTCDEKDRHVLAAAYVSNATHLVTANVRDFPRESWPGGLLAQHPDDFLLDRLSDVPDLVIEAIQAMSARLKAPHQSATEIADLLAKGQLAPRFGVALRDSL